MPLTLNVQSFARLDASSVIKIISTATDGTQGNDSSYSPSFSADGRYAVFDSHGSNLVAGDANGTRDIFRKDLVTGEVRLLSTAADGTQGNGPSSNPSFSLDGRYAVFESYASNLVAGDTNSASDIFRKDLLTGAVIRVSTATDKTQANGFSGYSVINADGRYVMFLSNADNLVVGDDNIVGDVFLKDLESGTLTCVSQRSDGVLGNVASGEAAFSPDGKYVLFGSSASNLVANDTNGKVDIFYKNLATKEITRLSVTANGTEGKGHSTDFSFSADGRYVIFQSEASNLVEGDTNGTVDIFRKDLVTGEVARISTTSDGSQANEYSGIASLSADGRYLVFESLASNLVPGDTNDSTDIFRKDLMTGAVIRLSAAADGVEGNTKSYDASLSPDGRYAIFNSDATTLVPGDTNDSYDIFLVDIDRLADGPAIAAGRFVEMRLGVGAASSVSLAWGDGTTSTVTPVSGSAAFSHAYATAGTKSAVATVVEGRQSLAVSYLIDLASGAMTRNVAVASQLTGSKAADALTGDAFANKIYGGYGKDVLTGLGGRDIFVFNSKLGTATTDRKKNFDKIVDFNVKDDTLYLDNAIFKKLGKGSESKPGKLNKAFFTIGDQAKDANDYLVYNKKTGVLSYDADGSGAKAAIEFAQLKKNLKMTYKDFFVV